VYARLLTLLILFPFFPLQSIEHSPWFGADKELRNIISYTYQHSSYIALEDSTLSLNSKDNLLSLAFSLSPTPTWNFQTQLQGDYKAENFFFLTHLEGGAEKNWLNDILGDPISLTSNLLLRIPTSESLKNPSTPYNASVELETGISIGREISKGPIWIWRYWCNTQFGIGSKGSPWIYGSVSIEKKLSPHTQLLLSTQGNLGFGDHTLTSLDNFKGYAPYPYQSIAIVSRYTHSFPSYGNLFISYSYRPYALFFPAKQSTLTLSFSIPLSITTSFTPWSYKR